MKDQINPVGISDATSGVPQNDPNMIQGKVQHVVDDRGGTPIDNVLENSVTNVDTFFAMGTAISRRIYQSHPCMSSC